MATARVEIDAGICGHTTTVVAESSETGRYTVRMSLQTTCPHLQKIGPEFGDIDASRQIGLRQGLPSVLQSAYEHCAHAACPVPCGMIKAIEVAAGLALPKDVCIRISSRKEE